VRAPCAPALSCVEMAPSRAPSCNLATGRSVPPLHVVWRASATAAALAAAATAKPTAKPMAKPVAKPVVMAVVMAALLGR
jgi:hypothetical protein